ncbi:MAG: DUF1376 domain-containing protein [Caulobacteraceae bacterium]|nr:DUF1376 domain-containing protein [Caulobacteraceae bacterium]
MTPPTCDLRALQFMPLDIVRLFGSSFHARATDSEWRAGVTLWLRSFHQVPAASLPDDDIELARLAEMGRDIKAWRKLREGALRGWVKCSDGRLYHPVVAEKALDAMERREEFAEAKAHRETRQQRWRERCKALSTTLRQAGITPPRGANLKALEDAVRRLPVDGRVDGGRNVETSTVDVNVDGRDGAETSTVDGVEIGKTGTGTGTGTSYSESKDSARSRASDKVQTLPLADIDPDKDAWDRGVRLLTVRGKIPEKTARSAIGRLISSNALQAKDLLPALAQAEANATQDPLGYLTKSAASLAKRRSSQETPRRVGFV